MTTIALTNNASTKFIDDCITCNDRTLHEITQELIMMVKVDDATNLLNKHSCCIAITCNDCGLLKLYDADKCASTGLFTIRKN